jgi:nucleoside-diphosphate kinase
MPDRVYRIAEQNRQTYPSRAAAIARIGELIAKITGKIPLTPALGFYCVQDDGAHYKLDLSKFDEVEFEVVATKTHSRLNETAIDELHEHLMHTTLETSHTTFQFETPPPPTATFALIKPGAFAKKDQVLDDIANAGFQILRQTAITTGAKKLWAEFYKEHANQTFYPGLLKYIMSGPVMALQLTVKGNRDADAIAKWCDTIGATDCTTGLRQKYGTVPPDNAFHGSDSMAAVTREMALFETYFK